MRAGAIAMNQEPRVLQELQTMDEEICWRAVQTRDASFNGIFVYGVRSTGIYCKPSCPSRRPQREQVIFFPSPLAAGQAGFRPCLRCLPHKARGPQEEMVLRACSTIEAHTGGVLSLALLGEILGVSPHHLQRMFKRMMGVTPHQYMKANRIEQFKARIKQGADVTSATYDAGYGSSSRLYEKATDHLGMTPATYRRGGRGMNISYTVVDSHLGRMLVAATERGVCAVSFGDSDASLEAALTAEYPAAEIHRDEAGFTRWVSLLLKHLGGEQPRVDLPLDLQATAFQLRVWQELRAIPYGSTRSYAEVASAIGQPAATRAVARACATNPVALATPCHRVIRGDGNLGGYRWGLERKQALLAREHDRATRNTKQLTNVRG